MTIEQVWVEKLRSLPPTQQQEALDFIDSDFTIYRKNQNQPIALSIPER